jgi:hypothetical protein
MYRSLANRESLLIAPFCCLHLIDEHRVTYLKPNAKPIAKNSDELA